MSILVKDWKSVLVRPHTSLEDALTTMDKSALRIVLVTDENNKLLGSLTDGDVRRALLKHVSLGVPVSQVMCSSPKTAQPDWNRERVLAVMEATVLLQLPIVDDNGHVVGLHTLHGLLEKRQLTNPVFLMAGGFGTRLHPLTSQCPKPLLKVGKKPLLELTLERFIDAGFHRFFISTHFLPKMIHEHFGDGSQWGVDIQYTHEAVPLGTGGALGLLPHEEINESLLLMNGDLLTTMNFHELLAFHQEHKSIATMAVRNYEYQVPYGVIENDGHLLRNITEKPIQMFFVNAGIYVLEPKLVKSIKAGTKIDMPTLLEQWIAKGHDVSTFPVSEYWLDIGQIEDFKRAQVEFKNLL